MLAYAYADTQAQPHVQPQRARSHSEQLQRTDEYSADSASSTRGSNLCASLLELALLPAPHAAHSKRAAP